MRRQQRRHPDPGSGDEMEDGSRLFHSWGRGMQSTTRSVLDTHEDSPGGEEARTRLEGEEE